MELRPAFKEELGNFLAFESEAHAQGFILPYTLQQHIDCFEIEDIVYLSIVDGAELIGFFLLKIENEAIEFRRVVITQSALGVGRMAIEKMHDYCQQILHKNKIWLDVFNDNKRAKHLYTKIGYKVIDRKKLEDKDLLIMEINL